MKIIEALSKAKEELALNGVSNGKLDSLILLSYAIAFTKEKIIFNPDFILNEAQKDIFFKFISRRSRREPISHIIGTREFYKRDFVVNSDVLDPRPDSESLIELVLEKYPNKDQKLQILEIGSGSGCLIITLLSELLKSDGIALDISKEALEICKKNANLNKIENRLEFLQLDIFAGFGTSVLINKNKKFDLIISNPPYIKSKEIEELQPEVRLFEPRIALDGGLDGLDFYRKIAIETKDFLCNDGKVILEIGFGQKNDVEKIFVDNGFLLENVKKDLAGIDRALCFKKKI